MAQSISQEAIGATGLPGATAASRHAGATASGAPATGTFAVGDYVVDQTGAMYVCTVAGTPGTWQLSGVSINENIAGKNFIINGGMDIWQRGTSFALSTSLAYSADRWANYSGAPSTVSQIASGVFNGTSTAVSSTTLTMSSATWNTNAYVGYTVTSGSSTATVTSNTATVLTFSAWTGGTPSTGSFSITGSINLQYALRVQRNSGSTATNVIPTVYNIETKNSLQLAGQTVTVSFWARAGANYSATSNLLNIWLQSGTGTDQNQYYGYYTGVTFPVNTTLTLTTSWQRFTYTGVVPSNSTQLGFQVYSTPTGTAGTNDYYDITGVQLEIAPQATPFSRAGGSIGGELALCQRYYQRIAGNNNVTSVGTGFAISSASVGSVIPLETSMRAAPSPNYGGTIYLVGPTTTTTISSLNAIYAGANNPQSVYLTVNTSGSTSGQAIIIYTASGSANYVEFSSEL